MEKKFAIKKSSVTFLLSTLSIFSSLNIETREELKDGPRYAPITLYNTDQPLVSIIIPAYNHFDYTYKCLSSIANNATLPSVEVIVVDDCSTDGTWSELSKINNVRALHNEKNMGFIEACNKGAQAARGKYLIFLNNDTVVHEDWIEALLSVFKNHRNVGLVGAKLIYPDGKLQEAGSILYCDGSGSRYGWMQDANDSRFNYVREVDYVSGAAIIIKAKLFKKIKGFDSCYTPAYYEDTDLAQKVRREGLRVMYQPAAKVVHYESITLADKKFHHMVINHKKFFSRWQTAIALHPTHEAPIEISCEHRCTYRVLIIGHHAGSNQKNFRSSITERLKSRNFKSLRTLLKNNCKVYLFPLGQLFGTEYVQECEQMGVEVINESFDNVSSQWLKTYGPLLNFILIPNKEKNSSWTRSLQKTLSNVAFIFFDTKDDIATLLEGPIT